MQSTTINRMTTRVMHATVCVHVCVHARACVYVCVCVCMCVGVCLYGCVFELGKQVYKMSGLLLEESMLMHALISS